MSAALLMALLGVLLATQISAHVGSAPDANTIHACSNNNHVRIVAAGNDCKKIESPLDWSVTGPAGADGADGADGSDGADGVSGFEIVSVLGTSATSVFQGATLTCPAGKKALGGGFFRFSQSLSDPVVTVVNGPHPNGLTWNILLRNNASSPGTWGFNAYATCASVSP